MQILQEQYICPVAHFNRLLIHPSSCTASPYSAHIRSARTAEWATDETQNTLYKPGFIGRIMGGFLSMLDVLQTYSTEQLEQMKQIAEYFFS